MATTTLQKPPAPPTDKVVANAWTLALDPPGAPALNTALRGRFSRRPAFTTPQRLWGAVAGVSLGALALWAACAGALGGARAGLKGVGQDAAPSIVAANHLRAALADVDANLVNGLLCPPRSEEAGRAAAAVTEKRREVAETLVQAAEHITLGERERVPLSTLAENTPAHEATFARARAALAVNDREAALAAERDAADGLRLFLQPAAVLLDYNKAVTLDKAYARARSRSATGLALVLGVGGALTVGLLALQLWLTGRTRRLLNPGLLGATALAAGLTLWTGVSLLRAGGQLRTGTEDAFASVRYVWQTRALAYGINGEESRWLFDRDEARAKAAERAFVDGAARIGWRAPEPGRPPDALTGALAAAANRVAASDRVGLRMPAEPGYLQQELDNITYAGEREAATEALSRFQTYFEIDRRIRDLELHGDHVGALALCLSDTPGGSKWAFGQFDAALERVLKINMQEFDLAITRGLNALGGPETLAPAVALGIVALAFLGIRPRLREYAL